jgi:hypothetical protein
MKDDDAILLQGFVLSAWLVSEGVKDDERPRRHA